MYQTKQSSLYEVQGKVREGGQEYFWSKCQLCGCPTCSLETETPICPECVRKLSDYQPVAELSDAMCIIEVQQDIRTGSEVSELQRDAEWLGTRTTISGGEVMELDTYLESRYDDSVDEIPF